MKKKKRKERNMPYRIFIINSNKKRGRSLLQIMICSKLIKQIYKYLDPSGLKFK